MPDAPPPIKAQPASADQKAWHAYRRASQQEEPKRLEEAAKFLAGMVSITFTILLSADKALLRGQAPLLQALASLAWLIALLLAFLVLYLGFTTTQRCWCSLLSNGISGSWMVWHREWWQHWCFPIRDDIIEPISY